MCNGGLIVRALLGKFKGWGGVGAIRGDLGDHRSAPVTHADAELTDVEVCFLGTKLFLTR